MANFTEFWRSNYFQVDPEKADAFDAWCDATGVERCCYTDDKDVARYAIWSEDGEGLPSCIEAPETGEEIEIEAIRDLEDFLAPGETLIVVSCGQEQMRVLSGCALARHKKPDGTILRHAIDLQDIYGFVEDTWGITDYSTAEY